MNSHLLAPVLLAFALATPAAAQTDINIAFPAPVWDMEVDLPRQQIYVSMPTRNSVAIVSMQTYQIVNEVLVGANPRGIDLSIDGTRLFAALNQSGSVSVLDLTTLQHTEILVATQLGSSLAFDVIEGKPNRLYVSANPNSGGFAYIVQIKLDQGNFASRVASDRIIRADPVFEDTPNHQYLHIGEGFSPNSLYKLDLQQDTAPIILEDQHGTVGGTNRIQLNPDGSLLYLNGGQVVRTSDYTQAALLGPEVPQFNDDPTRVYMAKTNGILDIYSTSTFLQIGSINLNCSFSIDLREFAALPGSGGYLLLGDSKLCGRVQLDCDASIASYCPANPNSVGPGANLVGSGTPSVALNNVMLDGNGFPPNVMSVIIFGAESAQLPFGGGYLCISPYAPGLLRLGGAFLTTPSGTLHRHLDFTQPPLLGGPITPFSTWYFQVLYRDATLDGTTVFNTSNALEVSFCP
jgi:hypothetical protein